MNVKQTRHCYTIKHKLAVVAYAKQHGNRAAERRYGSLPTPQHPYVIMRCPAPYALYIQIFRDDKNVVKTRRTKQIFVGDFELNQVGNMDEVPPTNKTGCQLRNQ